MEVKDILKIVKDAFDKEISSSCSQTEFGPESWIDGKDEFIKTITKKLNLLLKQDSLFDGLEQDWEEEPEKEKEFVPFKTNSYYLGDYGKSSAASNIKNYEQWCQPENYFNKKWED